MLRLIGRLFKVIKTEKKLKLFFLFLLTLISSIAEVVSLGSLLPFIGFVSNPDSVKDIEILNFILSYFKIDGYLETVRFLAYTFILAAITAGLTRLLLLRSTIQLSRQISADLNIEIYKKVLTQNYLKQISMNSGELISSLTQKVGQATSVLISVITVGTSSILFFSILGTLILINPKISLAAGLIFGIIYFFIVLLNKKKLIKNSELISTEHDNEVKILQESLGSIRDIIISNTYKIFFHIYNKTIVNLNRASAQNAYISQSPRFFMETIGMVLIASIIIFYSKEDFDLSSIIPLLAVLALGAQRLLPLMQIIYGNLTVIMGSNASLEDVLKLLNKKEKKHTIKNSKYFKFKKNIVLKNISFKYLNKSKYVLKNINLEIKPGERVGVIGETGSGKSTLIDIFAGLIKPTKGNIYIDGELLSSENTDHWYSKISYVPQNIFLLNSTLKENIAFGVPKRDINIKKIKLVSKIAKLNNFILKNKDKYNQVIGEKGIKLSGGQRQRVGIARSLYRGSNVILFDEATAALDIETEKKVIDAINNISRNVTIVMIAHRISTLKYCDKIVKLKDGSIEGIFNYNEIKDY